MLMEHIFGLKIRDPKIFDMHIRKSESDPERDAIESDPELMALARKGPNNRTLSDVKSSPRRPPIQILNTIFKLLQVGGLTRFCTTKQKGTAELISLPYSTLTTSLKWHSLLFVFCCCW